MYAAQVIDEPTERFVLDLGGLRFLGCAGARTLAAVTNLLPSGCPVIIRSLSPVARQIIGLLGTDLRQEPGVEDARASSAIPAGAYPVPAGPPCGPASRPAESR